MSMVTPNLRAFLERYIPIIERELFSFLPVQEPKEYMYLPMRDYPERGGKRFCSSSTAKPLVAQL